MDDKLKENGRYALHRPPYCPDLTPIELVCGDMKNKVAQE
jgi:transposase